MNDNKKIAINSIIIFARLCITSIVGILASRFVLDALGASDYGLYNVVGGIVTVLNVFNTAMLSTTYRYIAYETGKGEGGNLNKIFNTSLIIHVGFVFVILLLGCTIGEWYINNHLNVAPNRLEDARFVFRLSIATTAISTIHIPYQGLVVAYEKFNVTALIEIITQILKLLAVIFILKLAPNRLRMYSCIMLAIVFISSLSYIFYCYRKHRGTVSFRVATDSKQYKEMLSFASWTLVGAAANVGKIQGSAIIINLFFGTVVNAAFAVANQVENFILMFARSLNNAAIPQITKNFSGGNQQRSIKLTAYISKYTFILMSLVAFPVMLEMDFLLGLWLKDVPEGANVFCVLMVLTGLLGCLGEGIPAMINATGKIKAYQIVVHSLLLLGLPIGYLAYKYGASYYAISVVYCVIIGVSGFVKLYMLRRVVNFSVKEFFQVSYSRILYVSIPLIAYYFLYDPENFSTWGHVVGLIISELFLLVVIYVLGLDKRERSIVNNVVIKIKKRFFSHK